MEKRGRLKISDFAKLTGSTLKTVIYYHKIGLLPEPERSPGGYRLYGPAELTRMRLIKRLRSLGLNLKRSKEILGDLQDYRTLREVLHSLRVELLDEIKSLEERVASIEGLLEQDTFILDEDAFGSPSFQMMTEILGQDQADQFARACPKSFDRQRKLCGILDDFGWGDDYRKTFRALAEYWKAHPREYQTAMEYGARFEKLAQLPEDDPEVETLARAVAAFMKNMRLFEETSIWPGPTKPLEILYAEMAAGVLSPAQLKYNQLLQQYFNVQS